MMQFINVYMPIDDYAKEGVQRAVWTLCGFNHNPLRY